MMTAVRFFLFASCCASLSHANTPEWQYTVQAGDTLWSIARTHLSSMSHAPAIARLNGIRNPYMLKPASTLRIPLPLMRQHRSSATVSDLVGEASLDGQPLQPGQQLGLSPGQLIRTGANSTLKLVLEEGSLISIGPNARFVVKDATHYPSTGASTTWLNIDSGSIENNVIKNPLMPNRHTIQTPSAITAVRGTSFRVNIGREDESATEVVEGEVAVSSEQGAQAVRAGFGSVTRRGQAPGSSVALPPAPDLSPMAATYAFSPAMLQWVASEGMSGYQAQLMRIAPKRRIIDDRLLTQAGWQTRLDNGRYLLTVRSQLPNGLQGYPASREFVVHAHPAPPLVISPQDGTRLRERSVNFHFSGDSSARYRVALFRQHSDAAPALSWDMGPTDAPRTLPEPGTWHWRVARLDKQGQPGPFSQAYTLQTDAGLWRASYTKGMQFSSRPYPLPGARYQLTLQALGKNETALVYHSDQPRWQDIERPYSGRYRISIKVNAADGYQATELEDTLQID